MGIIVSLVAEAIIISIAFIIQGFSKPYSGVWYDQIFEDEDRKKVVKQDQYRVYYNSITGKIYGNIKRLKPADQAHRKWKFQGIVYEDNIIFSFWGDHKEIDSKGCVYVKHSGDSRYEGYYLEEHKGDGVVDKTPIKFCRDKNDGLI